MGLHTQIFQKTSRKQNKNSVASGLPDASSVLKLILQWPTTRLRPTNQRPFEEAMHAIFSPRGIKVSGHASAQLGADFILGNTSPRRLQARASPSFPIRPFRCRTVRRTARAWQDQRPGPACRFISIRCPLLEHDIVHAHLASFLDLTPSLMSTSLRLYPAYPSYPVLRWQRDASSGLCPPQYKKQCKALAYVHVSLLLTPTPLPNP